jgi:hypothetical protein
MHVTVNDASATCLLHMNKETDMNESNNASTQPSPRVSNPRHWSDFFKHRWPTLCGIALALFTALGGGMNREFTSFLSTLLIFMAFIYLASAVLGKRSSAWLVFLVGLVVITVLKILELNIISVYGLLLLALAFLVFGVVRGQWRETNSFPLETVGMIVFAAVALLVLNVNLVWAGYIAAIALFAHAAWDVIHLWRNRVVARSYAEFCAVLDAVLGVVILVMMGLRA